MVTCTGCALLCEDIEAIVENNRIKETRNTCRRGAARMKGATFRLVPSIAQKSTDIESAIKNNDEPLNETFLGHKILNDGTWPWYKK